MTCRNSRWLRAVAATAAAGLLALAAASCQTGSKADGAAPGDPSPSSLGTPLTVSPSWTATEEKAIAAAKPTIDEYFATYDAVLKDPAAGPQRFETVATGQELIDLRLEWRMFRDRKIRATGTARFGNLTITNVDITGHRATVEANVCYDVTNTEVVDQQGNVVTAKQRVDKTLNRLRLVNADWPDGRWMVAWTQARNQPCK